MSKEGYDADYEASRIQRQTIKKNKKLKELEEKIEKLTCKSLNKIKMFKMVCEKNITHMKNARSKIKPIKTGKKLEGCILYGVKITPIILNHKKQK